MSQPNKDAPKSQKIIQVNSSSIVDLKAELFRKQEQVRQQKNSTDSTIIQCDKHLYDQGANKTSTLPKKLLEAVQQSDDNNKRNKQSLIKKKDDEQDKKELTEAEERALQKSRENLERKAKLYDQISKGQVEIDPDDENILVNFNQKHSIYESDEDDKEEDLVEYIDQFGRTKMVTRDELEQLEKEREEEERRELQLQEEESNSDYDSETNNLPPPPKPTVSNIHYQHVREGEIRDHGVGFYSFSEDEQIRRQQMEMLDQLRKETESNKNEKRRIKEKRKRMLKSRLEKIAARKGITLPIAKSDDIDDDDDDDDASDDNKDSNKKIRLEKATLEIKIPQTIGPREWDLGKEGVTDTNIRTKTPFYSQERYQEKLRKERNPEFAPPTLYHHSGKSSFPNERQRSQSNSSSKSEHPDMFQFIKEKISEIRKKS
ncbi:hypothetical protein DERP_009114 [Dermatophagoides pteronyssinus]|uniref:Uncharacterized protein n=2 Tax=Dermatophagoides pteronyssinus TaxID=6956 RepID=A0ABQ8JQT8_DERPT|nr:coiled-coil domain-containing protein 174-like [Dermatophagoides pteronyssinus]KAH9424892.1 hypothetical protein DERP_009114 [Dermatophagoides pteronyssinus]